MSLSRSLRRFSALTALVALGLVACGDSESQASGEKDSLLDSAKVLAGKAAEALRNLKDLDVSKLSTMSPEQVQELGKTAMTEVATQLDRVKDKATAENAKQALDPILEKMGALKGALAGKLPDASQVQAAIQSLQARLGMNGDVMSVLQPVLSQIKGLIGG
jgi:hypothetical protein